MNGPLLARRFVQEVAAGWALDGATSELCLIATELVTNAITHGAPPTELTLHRRDGEVTIEVTDGDPRVDNVRLRTAESPAPGGRGLHVVASLAERWGTRHSQTGKTVWATVLTTNA